jgi:hypothetical protein
MPDPLAGDFIYATDITRSRPKMYWDAASSALGASQNNVDIPGISISFTTETVGAELTLWWFIQADPTAASTTAAIVARPRVTDPSAATSDASVYSMYSSFSNAADQATPGQAWKTTLGAAGSYTVTLKGVTAANQQINIYTTLTAMVQEQYS